MKKIAADFWRGMSMAEVALKYKKTMTEVECLIRKYMRCAACGEVYRTQLCKGCSLENKLLPCYPPSNMCERFGQRILE